jgi:hypothetical protein
MIEALFLPQLEHNRIVRVHLHQHGAREGGAQVK